MPEPSRVWVVEMCPMKGCRWSPVGYSLRRAFALDEMTEWKKRNPDDLYRVVEYVRARTQARHKAVLAQLEKPRCPEIQRQLAK